MLCTPSPNPKLAVDVRAVTLKHLASSSRFYPQPTPPSILPTISSTTISLPVNATGLQRELPSDFKPINSNGHFRPYENGSLAIHNANKLDTGFFMCAASNGGNARKKEEVRE